MALSTDPYWTEIKLRSIRGATTGTPRVSVNVGEPATPPRPLAQVLPECEQSRARLRRELEECAREIPPADPVEAKLDRIIAQNAEILALLRGPAR